MADFYVPKEEDTTINLHDGEVEIKVDISHINEMLVSACDEAEKTGSTWQDHFVALFQSNYGIRLGRTASVLLVKQSEEMIDTLKKSFSQSPSSTKGTRSRSPKS
jgi:hypothetical protein